MFQSPAPREYGQPAKQDLLTLGQKVPTPIDERLQSLVSRQGRPAPADQQAEAIVEAGRDLLGGHDSRTGCGQFKRKRDAVQLPDDLGDRRDVAGRELEIRANSPGPLEEKLDSFRRLQFSLRHHILSRERQRRHLESDLPADGKRFPAGNQDLQQRTSHQEIFRQFSGRLDEMLGVVQ